MLTNMKQILEPLDIELEDFVLTPVIDSVKLLDIEDDEYFGEKYKHFISNSRLGLLNPDQDGSPEKFFAGFKSSEIFSDALLLGSAIHQLFLQRESYYIADNIDRPNAKIGFIADMYYPRYCQNKTLEFLKRNITDILERVDYYSGKYSDKRAKSIYETCLPYWKHRKELEDKGMQPGGLFLSKSVRNKTIECLVSLSDTVEIDSLLNPVGIMYEPITMNESTFLMELKVQSDLSNKKEFTFALKGKLDNFTIDFDDNILTINDLKTIGKPLEEFEDNFNKFHYAREISFYRLLLESYWKKHYPNEEIKEFNANCIVVSTIPPYKVRIYRLSSEELKQGKEEYEDLLRLAAYYFDNGYEFTG